MIATAASHSLLLESPHRADERFLRRILVIMIAATLGCAAMVAALAAGSGWESQAHIAAILAQ
ncbi:hypothetical protein BH10PSE7_BH10PSE7_18740 [soil metagenome]